MIEPIFSKEDFKLCYVPAPKGYPQSQTHSGVIDHNGRVYLTTSPFPNIKAANIRFRYIKGALRRLSRNKLFRIIPGEYYENPCLYIADKDDKTAFSPIYSNPLIIKPDNKYGLAAYNSDPDISVIDGEVYILNRQYFRRPDAEPIINIQLIRGNLNEEGYTLVGIETIYEGIKQVISPSMCKVGDKNVFCYIDTRSVNNVKQFSGIYLNAGFRTTNLSEVVDDAKKIKVETQYQPWHSSLFSYNDTLYAVIACVDPSAPDKLIQTLGIFNDDLSLLKIFDRPLTTLNSYRSSAYVDSDGLLNLYLTTVHENFINGNSIDGREVCLLTCVFEQLLK